MTDPNQQPVKKKIPGWAKLLIFVAVVFALIGVALSIGIHLLGGLISSRLGTELTKDGIEKAIEKGIEQAGGNKTDVQISDGGVVIKDKATGEKVAFGGSDQMPENFPKDIPTYPNGRLASSMVMGPLSMVTFETTDSLKTVGDFYNEKLVAEGWQSLYASQPTPEVFSGMFKKDARQVSVSVTNSEGKSTLVLTYGLEQAGTN